MAWQRPLFPDSIERQMLSDRAMLHDAMQETALRDGRKIRYFDTGHGEALLYMPMIPELNFIYAPQISRFSISHRTLTYEPLLSRTKRVGIRDRAEQTLGLMDALGIDAAHLVAWSDGGAAAYDLARTWPDRCRSLVFLCLPDRYVLPPVRQFLSKLLRFLPVEYVLPDGVVRRFLSHYLSGPRVPAELIARYAQSIPGLTSLFKYSALPNLYQHHPLRGEVTAPALAITGDLDTLVTIEQARRMTALMPNCRPLAVIKRGEHLLNFANADEVNEVMESFYGSLTSPPKVR